MKKSGQNPEVTRKNLMDSFWELYKNNDLDKITITQICKNANYDRSTFYRYFFDISDVLNNIEDYVIDGMRNSITGNKNVLDVPFSKFQDFNNKYGEYIIVFTERANKHFYLKYKELIKSDVFDYLNLNVQSENKKEFLFEFLFSSVLSSYVYWYRHQEMMNIGKFTDMVNNMIIHGSQMIVNSLK